MGSNTIRLSIYQCETDGIKLLLNKKTMAGLAGYVEDGALSPKGIHKACSVLNSYQGIVHLSLIRIEMCIRDSVWLVLFAVSKIFDYGCVLQKEHDETL